jgi:hypothetical protein
MKIITSILILFMAFAVQAQKVTLSGIVTDAETGETLVSANVILRTGALKGTTTDVNGFFSLPGIEYDQFNVEIHFVGYEKVNQNFECQWKAATFY